MDRLAREHHAFIKTPTLPKSPLVGDVERADRALKAMRGFMAADPANILNETHIQALGGPETFVLVGARTLAGANPDIFSRIDWRKTILRLRRQIDEDLARAAEERKPRLNEWLSQWLTSVMQLEGKRIGANRRT